MVQDSDVVLMGTGLAPLVAAAQLISQERSVVVLNPDRDFFLEDSELPLDPMLGLRPEDLTRHRFENSTLEKALQILQPQYPGTVEFWSERKRKAGFSDPLAPHLRQRSRFWVGEDTGQSSFRDWAEQIYLQYEEADVPARLLEGGAETAVKFPGFAGKNGPYITLEAPDACDADVSLYRNGILEYLRERLGSERIFPGVHQVDWSPEGLRFTTDHETRTVRVNQRMLIFWTPRMTSWLTGFSKRLGAPMPEPAGVRLWEQWSLLSKKELNPNWIGHYKNMTVWAEVEGPPQADQLVRLAILRPGPLLTLKEYQEGRMSDRCASEASFQDLNDLCCNFLGWSRYSIRSMRLRAVMEWPKPGFVRMKEQIKLIMGADGPLVDVVHNAQYVAARIHVADVKDGGAK